MSRDRSRKIAPSLERRFMSLSDGSGPAEESIPVLIKLSGSVNSGILAAFNDRLLAGRGRTLSMINAVAASVNRLELEALLELDEVERVCADDNMHTCIRP